MIPTEEKILAILCDGKLHSGVSIASNLKVSRSAVHKHIKLLHSLGVEVHAIPGRGYRLSQAIELLNHQAIDAHLTRAARSQIAGMEIHFTLDSTNDYCLQQLRLQPLRNTVADPGSTRLPPASVVPARVVLAEYQRNGRGRRGKPWVSPFAGNLYLSLQWHFVNGALQLGGLSIVIGVALAKALTNIGVPDLRLKWPNDIYCRGAKLGGILIDVVAEASGPCTVVIGVGLNVKIPGQHGTKIDQSWTDLEMLMGRQCPKRNQLVAELLNHLCPAIEQFEQQGLTEAIDAWSDWDMMRGQEVILQLVSQQVRGTARGIDSQGAILLDTEAGLRRFTSGEVSLRTAT